MAGAAKPDTRPLSPHLQVWRWHVTMAASILHRVSGVALYVGALGLVVWLVAVAMGQEAFGPIEFLLQTVIGQLALYVFSVAISYHLAQGLRHLFWDAGYGFKPAQANATAWVAIVFALVAPIGVWALANL
jgi:succinate dehydrogenase / fumarate reductase cytochrome b subunit